MEKHLRASASSLLGLRGEDQEIVAALLEKTSLGEGYGLPSWNQAQNTGAKIGLVLRGDLPVKLAPGAGPYKDTRSQRFGTAACAVEKIGESTSAGRSTEGWGAQDTESNSAEEEK